MKKTLLVLALAASMPASAQKPQESDMEISFYPHNVEKYDVRVYSNRDVSHKISSEWQRQSDNLASGERGAFWSGLWTATQSAALGIAGQGATSLASVTVSTLANSIKSKKSAWQNAVKNENRYEKKIYMVENVDDFYSDISDAGALDPSGMSFNGFSCLQQRGTDTVFFISCHLDTTANGLARILKHSKFELTLDTMIFNPSLCNLPNDSLHVYSQRKAFSFEERKNLMFSVDVELYSSWINQAIQMYSDVRLGKFSISCPISKKNLGLDNMYRYVAGVCEENHCEITGDSFIVPRSYIGVRDAKGNFHDAWGTGQYRIVMTIKESCGISPEFEKNWKADWKSRPKQSSIKQDLVQSVKQIWNKNSNAWICTLTEAPVSYSNQQVMAALGLSSSTQMKQGAMQGQGAQQQGAQKQQNGNNQPFVK